MALTQEQWYKKIVSILPRWWFEDPSNQEAHAQALAKVFSILHEEAENHQRETFISLSAGEYLDQHGEERQVIRGQGVPLSQSLVPEFDAQYQVRIRYIRNQSSCPAIKAVVDQLLMVGDATILEDFNSSLFINRDLYLNRGFIVLDAIVNVFSIVVDKQLHEPYSFMDREYFCNRDDFIGSSESNEYVFQLILDTVNQIKAEGTLYRIVERLE